MTKKLTYHQALKEFRQTTLAELERRHGPSLDKPRKGQAWVVYLDQLARQGRITQKASETWDNPFYK